MWSACPTRPRDTPRPPAPGCRVSWQSPTGWGGETVGSAPSPGRVCTAPALPPWHPGPMGGLAPSGQVCPRPRPTAGAGQGVWGSLLPPPAPPLPLQAAGATEGSRGGSLGSGWSPSFLCSPRGAGSRWGRPAQAFLPPIPSPGTRVPEGEWEGWGVKESPFPLNLWICRVFEVPVWMCVCSGPYCVCVIPSFVV